MQSFWIDFQNGRDGAHSAGHRYTECRPSAALSGLVVHDTTRVNAVEDSVWLMGPYLGVATALISFAWQTNDRALGPPACPCGAQLCGGQFGSARVVS
jgi:hypothetical protein